MSKNNNNTVAEQAIKYIWFDLVFDLDVDFLHQRDGIQHFCNINKQKSTPLFISKAFRYGTTKQLTVLISSVKYSLMMNFAS